MAEILESKIDTSSKEFKENYKDLESKTSEIKKLINRIKLGGGEKSIAKHKERGKLTARERIQTLIDSYRRGVGCRWSPRQRKAAESPATLP